MLLHDPAAYGQTQSRGITTSAEARLKNVRELFRANARTCIGAANLDGRATRPERQRHRSTCRCMANRVANQIEEHLPQAASEAAGAPSSGEPNPAA